MLSVFCSYSHKDEALREQLVNHLKPLERQGLIAAWHDRQLAAGDTIDAKIDKALDGADIILLLISADFLASDYCYSREMTRALERHEAGAARVVPVILRPCDWVNAPFGKLLAVPTDGKPVTKWPSLDDAFLDVTTALRRVVREAAAKPAKAVPVRQSAASGDGAPVAAGRGTGANAVDTSLATIKARIAKAIVGSDLGGTVKLEFGAGKSLLVASGSVSFGWDTPSDCWISIDLVVFDELASGRLSFTAAVSRGMIVAHGKMQPAMRLFALLQKAAR